jgi:hypothetical protein
MNKGLMEEAFLSFLKRGKSPILNELIVEEQPDFLQNRQIQDAILFS